MHVFLFSLSYSLCSVARFSSDSLRFYEGEENNGWYAYSFHFSSSSQLHLISVTLFGELIKHTANTLWFGEMCGIYTLHFGR